MAVKSLYGTVSSEGTIISGTGYTVQRVSKGTYSINFIENFSEVPAIVGSQTGFGNGQKPEDVVDFPYLDHESATAITGNTSDDHSDRQFSFIVMGQCND